MCTKKRTWEISHQSSHDLCKYRFFLLVHILHESSDIIYHSSAPDFQTCPWHNVWHGPWHVDHFRSQATLSHIHNTILLASCAHSICFFHIMLSIANLWKHLGNYAGLLDHCSWCDLDSFICITSHICDEIRLHTPPASQQPPHWLPGYIHAFLTQVLQLEDILVIQLWAGLKSFIWSLDANDLNLTDQEKRQMDVVGRRHLVLKKK